MSIIKKNVLSTNLEDYSVAILGESGIGKSTLMKEACEKLFGENGYVIFNAGREQGIDAIDGAAYVDVPNWNTFIDTVKELIANKDTEYKDLKVVIFDTLDEIIAITEPQAINIWNKENLGKKDFTPSKTLNSTFGGFGRGEQKVTDMILEVVWKLQEAGIRVWYTAHTKTREIVDPISNATYTTLSTKMMQTYFNAFKTKMHVVGIACIDRTIETESTGRKNVVTKKDITVNKIKEERRKIVFRDDNYSVDSKSRLAGIVDEIPLTTDDFIKALEDAIANSKSSTPVTTKKKTIKKSEPVVEEPVIEDDFTGMNPPVEVDAEPEVEVEDLFAEPTTDSNYPENIQEVVKQLFTSCIDENVKATATNIIKKCGSYSKCDEKTLQNLYDLLK